MKTCQNHGCDATASWECAGNLFCTDHCMDQAIRTGRPAQLLGSPVVADDKAVEDAGDPVSVWDDLESSWESIDIDDSAAIEQLVVCAIEQGKTQAMELARLRAGGA